MNKQADPPRYGPNNPHPLSTLRGELASKGKYVNHRGVNIAPPRKQRKQAA